MGAHTTRHDPPADYSGLPEVANGGSLLLQSSDVMQRKRMLREVGDGQVSRTTGDPPRRSAEILMLSCDALVLHTGSTQLQTFDM